MQAASSEMMGTVKHMKKNGVFYIVIFCVIAGLILLFMGGGGYFDEKKEDVSESKEKIDMFEYKSFLEGEIKKLCLEFSGVTDAYVIVKLHDSGEDVYAKDKQYSNGSEREEYVIIGSGSSGKPIYLYSELPKISGIGVILKGNNIGYIKSSLEGMLSSSYGIAQNKVWVEIN